MTVMKKFGNRLKTKTSNWFHSYAQGSKIHYLQETLRQSQITNDYLMSLWLQGRPAHPNPLTTFGAKYFSQSDEDGILIEILRRLGLRTGTCVEIGCGDGLENNTLILLAQGWRSVWIDATDLAFDPQSNPALLAHLKEFVTAENIPSLVRRGLSSLQSETVDVLSVDIDGNDGYIAAALLNAGFEPGVIVIETNEVLPPPIRFQQPYQADYAWDKTKNSGWSLQSLANLLAPHGYRCVACNLQTGVNAFFVHEEQMKAFADVPSRLEDIYVGRSIHPLKYRDRRTSIGATFVEHLVRNTKPAT